MRLAQLIVLGLVLGVAAGWWLQRGTPVPETQRTRVAAPASVSAAAQAPPPGATSAGVPAGLLLPVQDIAPSQLRDTFTDARSEGRVHDAIDIMAAAGTPVLAVADGRVEKLFDSERGGLTIYQFEPTG
ncbi:MAG: M23 family metallopeptidase, partial [Stenotrophomonas sp.]